MTDFKGYDLTTAWRGRRNLRPLSARLTKGDISTRDGIAGPIHEHVEKMTAPLVTRIAELESRPTPS